MQAHTEKMNYYNIDMKEFTILLFLVIFIQSNLSSQSCLPNGITFSTQTEIDNFPSNYPNCTKIEGNVLMDGPYLTNLDSLAVLTSINGNLDIGQYDISNLTSISGLNNLNSIGGHLNISWATELLTLEGLDNLSIIGRDLILHSCFSLTNIESLNSLTSVGQDVFILLNNSLTNLNGLENLTSIQYSLEIKWNDALTSLSGLENINSIGGNLVLKDNDALISLEGLESLKTVQGKLLINDNKSIYNLYGLDSLTSVVKEIVITDNDSLISLSGIDNIDTTSIEYLYIYNNPYLSTCNVESICKILTSNATTYIYDNAINCNSKEEVESTCLVDISNINHIDPNILVYPNPTTNEINISSFGEYISQLNIYNQFGQKVFSESVPVNKINVSLFDSGIYIIELIINETRIRKKLIIR